MVHTGSSIPERPDSSAPRSSHETESRKTRQYEIVSHIPQATQSGEPWEERGGGARGTITFPGPKNHLQGVPGSQCKSTCPGQEHCGTLLLRGPQGTSRPIQDRQLLFQLTATSTTSWVVSHKGKSQFPSVIKLAPNTAPRRGSFHSPGHKVRKEKRTTSQLCSRQHILSPKPWNQAEELQRAPPTPTPRRISMGNICH